MLGVHRARLAARGAHQVRLHTPGGIQRQRASQPETNFVIRVRQHRQARVRTRSFNKTGRLGSTSLAQALIPPFRFFTLRKPALSSSSRARAERVPALQNSTISSALSSSERRAAICPSGISVAPSRLRDLQLVRLAHVHQADGIPLLQALRQLRGADIPIHSRRAFLVVVTRHAAESLVVDQLGHLRLRSADLALGVLAQLDELEGHIQGVVEQQAPDQRRPRAQDQLERLGRLQRADGARQHAQHPALGAGRHQPGGRRLGEQAAVARSRPRVEHAHLPVEAEDRAVHVGLAQQHAHVVGQVARREVIRAVDDHVVIGGDAHGVRRSERLVVSVHLDVGVQVQHAPARRLDLQHVQRLHAVDHLALQVGVIHHVVVHQPDAPHPGCRQVKGYRRAQPARADHQHRRRQQLALPFQPHFRHQQVARVAQNFFVRQCR